MREVDGFTLIDYIKSSIEILMNMKIDDGGDGGHHPHPFVDDEYEEDEEAREERRRRKKEKKEAKKLAVKKAEVGDAVGEAVPVEKKKEQLKRVIPKIDNHTPTSSIVDLQQKLDQISSPTSHLSSIDSSSMPSSSASIPFAHKEYEKALR